jgi:hypothetical protein
MFGQRLCLCKLLDMQHYLCYPMLVCHAHQSKKNAEGHCWGCGPKDYQGFHNEAPPRNRSFTVTA